MAIIHPFHDRCDIPLLRPWMMDEKRNGSNRRKRRKKRTLLILTTPKITPNARASMTMGARLLMKDKDSDMTL